MPPPQTRRSSESDPRRRTQTADTYVGIRIPAHLNDQIDAIARRESNGKSAVCRRLLSQALATLREHEGV